MLNKFLRLKILFAIFVLVIMDQIFKNAALAFLIMTRRINDFLSLEIYKNYGIALGLPVSASLFYFAVLVFLIFIFFGWKKKVWGDWREDDKGKICAAILIFAGAIGNIIDRARFGYIIDYINIGGLLVFNLADVFIAVGAIILLEKIFQKSRSKDGFLV